jgi:hypothetical protein
VADCDHPGVVINIGSSQAERLALPESGSGADKWWQTGFRRPLFMLLVAELR